MVSRAFGNVRLWLPVPSRAKQAENHLL